MSFSFKIAGASFDKYVAEVIPSFSKLQFFALLGGTETDSKRNYAGTLADSTLVGTPTYSAGYATISADANGFEAPMAAANGHFTHIMVTTVHTTNSGYCGRWKTGNTQDQLYRTTGNLTVAVDGNARASVAMAGVGFHFIAGTYDGTTATAYKGAGGALTKGTGAYSGGTFTTAKFRVGATQFGAGNLNCPAVLHAPTALSEAEILAIYGYLTRLLATRGVSVN